MIILGLDISLNCTGWSVVEIDEDFNLNSKKILDYGFIDRKKLANNKTLILLEEVFTGIIEQYKISHLAIEAPFLGKNPDTIQKLCHAHGIAMLVASKYEIPVVYYSVMSLKSIVLGGIKQKKEDGTKKTGDEMKEEVSNKIVDIFGEGNFIKPYTFDVTDSLSAIYAFITLKGNPIEKKPKKKRTK